MTTQQTESHTPQQLVPSVRMQKSATGCPTTSTNKLTAIKQLQDFALANYEDGGHWVYETFDCADYQQVLEDNKFNIEMCEAQLRHHWEHFEKLEQEYLAWGCEY